MKIYEWLRTKEYVQYNITCNIQEKEELFYWCEENIQIHSSTLYDPNWKWDVGKGPNDTMIYTFRYFDDAMAFKLRWM